MDGLRIGFATNTSMSFPPPTPKQARMLWTSLTALAIAVLVALIGLLCWGFGWLVNRLSSVLFPLAVAGVIACLLDPVVDFLEQKGSSRKRAIFLVFLLALMLVLLLVGTVVPRLIFETGQLVKKVPEYSASLSETATTWLQKKTPSGMKAKEIWAEYGGTVQTWFAQRLPAVSTWVLERLTRVASLAGLIIGFFLVPIYTFYFLKEKSGITRGWTDYLPLQESKWKQEVIFVLKSVNESLIVFFRGQILVAMCVGSLTTIGFLLLGLNYAVLLGVMTGLLGIIPYLGVICSIVPAVLLAVIQFGDWLHPLLVIGIFTIIHLLEGWVISPKIIGDRVGLHPLTIIVCLMVGTALMGGILGGVLAIPLTAALRTLMFRYVWERERSGSAKNR